MGIPSLFKKCTFEKFAEMVTDIKAKGVKVIGVDMYVLFHKFATEGDIAEVLAKNPFHYHDKMYERVKNYLMDFKNMGFDLYLVFDGNTMKYKIAEEDRALRRAAAYMKGDWMGALEIVPQQMYNFMHYIQDKMVVPYIVAPFEADAQLTYLFKTGVVDCVLTNDSDLIAYGVTRIIYIKPKGLEWYEHEKIDEKAEPESINQMKLEMLWLFGYLVGCDYFKGIPQVGIVKAFKILSQLKLIYENTEIDWESTMKTLSAIPEYSKAFQRVAQVTSNEILDGLATKVRMVFTSQAVIDPHTYELKYLNGTVIPENDRTVFGEVYDTLRVGKGEINPNNGEEFQLKRD